MTRWTEAATARLNEYFAKLRGSLAGSGADAEEVIEDLRRHVEAEAAGQRLTVVTEADVSQILARLGAPEVMAPVSEPKPAPSAVPSEGRPAPARRSRPGWWVLVFGVIIPFGAITFELVSGACAGIFFDPLPTPAHVVLAVFVPVVNLWTWLVARAGAAASRAWLGGANGAAMGIAATFSIPFLPLTPFALGSIVLTIGIWFYGIGLAPLAPLFSLIGAMDLRSHLRRMAGEETPLPGLWRGFALGLGAMVVFSWSIVLGRFGMEMAASDDPAESLRGVRLLRWADRHDELLRLCYGQTEREFGTFSSGKPMNAETARTLYYRVHGRPFNAVPPPKLYAGRERWPLIEQEFAWDRDQGGDAVAGRRRGLSLVHSRQDVSMEPEAAMAYAEWTLEFKNESSLQQESRAQILLPPGGVVSRLTLWIDGEEREAAFGGRGQVKEAYRAVVSQRRDPVLVSTCGPDRVLLQCFPVPANGGTMKVRVGITAPLALVEADEGWFRWPVLAERNFTISPTLHHALWADSNLPLTTTSGHLKSEVGKAGRLALRGQLDDSDLAAPSNVLRVRRPAAATLAWARDSRQPSAPAIVQTLRQRPTAAPDRVVLVVDGTAGMEPLFAGIAGALSRLPTNIDVAVLAARDGLQEVVPLQKGTTAW